MLWLCFHPSILVGILSELLNVGLRKQCHMIVRDIGFLMQKILRGSNAVTSMWVSNTGGVGYNL